jgi:hypothetical protein
MGCSPSGHATTGSPDTVACPAIMGTGWFIVTRVSEISKINGSRLHRLQIDKPTRGHKTRRMTKIERKVTSEITYSNGWFGCEKVVVYTLSKQRNRK